MGHWLSLQIIFLHWFDSALVPCARLEGLLVVVPSLLGNSYVIISFVVFCSSGFGRLSLRLEASGHERMSIGCRVELVG